MSDIFQLPNGAIIGWGKNENGENKNKFGLKLWNVNHNILEKNHGCLVGCKNKDCTIF